VSISVANNNDGPAGSTMRTEISLASTEGLSARSLIKHLGKAKVGQAHVTLVVEQHILELQVAVRIVNEPSGE